MKVKKLIVKNIGLKLMERILILDFETIRDPRSAPFIPVKGPRDRTDPAEKIAFDPNYIQPCVAGFCEAGRTWSIGQDDPAIDERALLVMVWNELELADRIITFNGFNFDLPLLLRRSWYRGVKPSRMLNMRKYSNDGPCIDVRMVLANWDSSARGSLDLYSNLKLGCCKTDGIDGSMVQKLWDDGETEKVHEYCRQDCLLTWELYESLKGYYI